MVTRQVDHILKDVKAFRELPKPQEEKIKEFLNSISKTKFLQPDGAPSKDWKVFSGDDWETARRNARKGTEISTWNATIDTGRGPTRDITENAIWRAAWGAKRYTEWVTAGSAAKNIVWYLKKHSTRTSRWDVAGKAATDIAIDAARDAILMASTLVVEDLNFRGKERHIAHADERWKVWQKGYGLRCDFNGTLYAYSAKSPASLSALARKE